MRYEVRADPEDEFDHHLCRVEEDGCYEILGTEAMEPEDVRFSRDLAWVPAELNWLAELITLKDETIFACEERRKAVEAMNERLRVQIEIWEGHFRWIKGLIEMGPSKVSGISDAPR